MVEKRIREQLERSERLRHNCAFKVNSVGLKLSAADRQEPVEKLVQVVDGFSVLDRLQQSAQLSSITVIVLTARDPQYNRERPLKAGACVFPPKARR